MKNMQNKDKINELYEILGQKYDLPRDAIDKFYFLYFEILKKSLLDGHFYASSSFGRFAGKLRQSKQIPEGFKINARQFYWLYKMTFKPSGHWAFRAGKLNSRDLFEYCSRFLNPCPNHTRKWFDPSYCAYIDKLDSPVPEKMLEWRKNQKKNNKKKEKS